MDCGCQGLSPHFPDEESGARQEPQGCPGCSFHPIGICMLLPCALSGVMAGQEGVTVSLHRLPRSDPKGERVVERCRTAASLGFEF